MAECHTNWAFYDKIDNLVYDMQDVNTGIPVKSQKYFRTSVPAAFTGLELVQWINQHFNCTDPAESLHLANLLCQHGYFFPVLERNWIVKDDNSLYRFQIPYYWPSHNSNPDNIEYAIYLSKRLMRNEQKHGLEEYEADAYGKLRELLGHMWEFVNLQAETQLKMFKEKKKIDKVVLDSQERAYWHLHRPPPGSNNVFEERYGKNAKQQKRKTPKDCHNEMERLKFALKTKPWLKTPKAVETLVSWCDQFSEYDPFLAGCQPGNPWVTDDPILWTLNTDFVEVPTERRVRRWGFSIQELIRDPIGRQVLETFLESEFSQENIRFYTAVQDLKYSPRSLVPAKVDVVYNEFLIAGAPCQVNVDSRTLAAVTKSMNDPLLPKRFCFSEAEEHIFVLMSKDSYPRFVRSEIYKGVLSAAQQQGSKKLGWRNFLFGNAGSGAQKKMSIASGTGKVTSSSPAASRSDIPSVSPNTQRQSSQGSQENLAVGQKKKISQNSIDVSRVSSSAQLPVMVEMSEEKENSSVSSAPTDSNLITPWDLHN